MDVLCLFKERLKDARFLKYKYKKTGFQTVVRPPETRFVVIMPIFYTVLLNNTLAKDAIDLLSPSGPTCSLVVAEMPIWSNVRAKRFCFCDGDLYILCGHLFPTLVSHKLFCFAIVTVFIVGDKQFFELVDFAFGDDEQSFAF